MTVKLALGTVQFGIVYGINNKTGRVFEQEAADIMRRACSAGVDMVDTSRAYGESEAVLGRTLPSLNAPFKIVSKFIVSPGATPKGMFADSCGRLRAKGLYAFLYHRFSDLREHPGWHKELLDLKAGGSLEKIGFSIYYPAELRSLIDGGVKFDLVQLPYSVFDRRFEAMLPELKKLGVEVHARSVFLQGLAFMDPAALPAGLEGMRPKLERLRGLAEKSGLPVSALCLCFGLLNPCIDRVVIGVDGLADLEDNLAGAARENEAKKIYDGLCGLREDDEALILPFRWKK